MRKWIGLAAAILCVAVLALVAIGMGRGVLAILTASGSGGEADPMFAPPPETVTRPPELLQDYGEAAGARDMSDTWVYENLTPVDKTAEELASEPGGN